MFDRHEENMVYDTPIDGRNKYYCLDEQFGGIIKHINSCISLYFIIIIIIYQCEYGRHRDLLRASVIKTNQIKH